MKRDIAWTLLALALGAACGDDAATTDGTTGGADGSGSTGAADGSGGAQSADATGSSGGEEDGTSGGATTGDVGGTDTGSSGGDPTEGGSSTGDETGATLPPTAGTLDQVGGHAGASAIAGGLTFLGLGPRLTVWDHAAAGAPVEIGRGDALDGMVTGVAIRGDRAYVTVDQDLAGTLAIFDIADPTQPTLVSALPYTNAAFSNPTDVLVDAGVLFIADTENGILSFDLTDPDQPVEIDQLLVFGVDDLALVDGHLRFRMSSFFGGFSVGTASHAAGVMTELGQAGLSGQGLDLAYAGADVYQVGLFGFEAFDLEDPTVAEWTFGDETTIGRAVEAAGDAVYVLGASGISVFDVSGPIPVPGDTVLMPLARAVEATSAGATLVGATDLGRGVVLDLAVPLSPAVAATFELPVGTAVTSAALGDGVLVVSDFYTGVRVIDPRDHASVGRYELAEEQPAAEGVAVVGNLAYLADWSSGLDIIDIADPAAPTLVGHASTGGFPSSVEVVGDYAYVGESTGGGALRIVDVSDPTSPDVLGMVPTSKVRDLVVEGGLAYLADEAVFDIGGLRIVDVADPNAPVQLGHYTGCQHALGVALQGTQAYIACASDDSVHVVDVADPRAPAIDVVIGIGALGVGSIAVAGAHLYVGHSAGIIELDATDPAATSVLAEHPAGWAVRRIDIAPDGTVLAAAGPAGLYTITPAQ